MKMSTPWPRLGQFANQRSAWESKDLAYQLTSLRFRRNLHGPAFEGNVMLVAACLYLPVASRILGLFVIGIR